MGQFVAMTVLLLGLGTVGAQTDADSKSTTERIDRHFSDVQAEFTRYHTIAIFGETVSGARPSRETIEEEIRLYEAVKKAGLLKDPSEQVFWLCQNLVIFAPKTGQPFLRELVENAHSPQALRFCGVLCLAAGEFGERLAVAQLKSGDLMSRKVWSAHLRQLAILEESVEPIIKAIEAENDVAVKSNLFHALASIDSTSPLKFVQDQARTATNDDIQAAALFACVEGGGYDGIAFIEGIKPIGPKSEKEKQEGLAYLRNDTSPASQFGIEVGNSREFVNRFGDLKSSPVITWLEKKGLLTDEAVRNPRKLEPADKDELLALLIDSKGFGVEAVKGSLMKSITGADLGKLMSLRASTWYSPNTMSDSRTKSISILMRHAGKSTPKQLPTPGKD